MTRAWCGASRRMETTSPVRVRDTDDSIVLGLTVAEYLAIRLAAEGIESRISQELKADGTITTRQYQAAARIAAALARGLRAYPELALRIMREPSRYVTDVPVETQLELAIGALKRLASTTSLSTLVVDREGLVRVQYARRILATLGYPEAGA